MTQKQTNLEEKADSIELEVKAGPEGENSDVYAWINSPLPKWAKTVDDPRYALPASIALEAAKAIARQNKEHITLKMYVKTNNAAEPYNDGSMKEFANGGMPLG